jgi:3-hydroxyacyl-CoA dehydrogenase
MGSGIAGLCAQRDCRVLLLDVSRAADFCGETLGKGVVHAKDTVNFIGDRIGCFWMLMGLMPDLPGLVP